VRAGPTADPVVRTPRPAVPLPIAAVRGRMHVFALMVRDLCGYELPVSSVSVVAVVVTASGCLRLASVRGHIHVNKLKQLRAVATRYDCEDGSAVPVVV
jgi:hypothetical protein